MIKFHVIDVAMPDLDFVRVREWIVRVIEMRGYGVGELHYYFCSDEALLDINRTRLGHDFYTDICTFPLDDCVEFISSEFCISLDRVRENAVLFGRSYENELERVVIHGVLHLVGFDDLTDEDERRMRAMEEECLKMLDN